jgi:hypothetical protein
VRWMSVALLVVVFLAACGEGQRINPPSVTVRGDERSLELTPWGYAWGGVDVDGAPPDPPADIGSTGQVEVRFPLEDWSFIATFRHADGSSDREYQVPLEADGDGRLLVGPRDPAGTYDVSLFGSGDEGDVIATFRWTTPPTQGRVQRPGGACWA